MLNCWAGTRNEMWECDSQCFISLEICCRNICVRVEKISDQFMIMDFICAISLCKIYLRNYILEAIASFCVCVWSRKSMAHTKRCAFKRKTSIIWHEMATRTKLSITLVKVAEIIDVPMLCSFRHILISVIRVLAISSYSVTLGVIQTK